jgi:hypothetical protein
VVPVIVVLVVVLQVLLLLEVGSTGKSSSITEVTTWTSHLAEDSHTLPETPSLLHTSQASPLWSLRSLFLFSPVIKKGFQQHGIFALHSQMLFTGKVAESLPLAVLLRERKRGTLILRYLLKVLGTAGNYSLR